MTFEKFLQEFNEKITPNKPEHIRNGQALMNYLHEVWPKEYDRVAYKSYLIYGETNIDCFYVDSLIPNTIKHLEFVWDQYPN